jgi:flagellar protein FlaG
MSDAIQPVTAAPPQRHAAPVEEAQGAPAAVAAEAVKPVIKPEQQAAPQVAQPGPSPEQRRQELTEAIQRLNEQVRKSNYNLNFSVDDSTNMVVVQVRNAQSGDVIRQIPSETVLRVAHNMEAVKGLLSDEAV